MFVGRGIGQNLTVFRIEFTELGAISIIVKIVAKESLSYGSHS